MTAANRPCDVQDLYARFTLDSASEFLFGHNLDTLSAALPEPGATQSGMKGSPTGDAFGSFTQAFEEAQVVVTRRARLGYFWPLVEMFGNRIKRPAQTTKRWLDPIVQGALAEKAKVRSSGVRHTVEDSTLLAHLADSTEGA